LSPASHPVCRAAREVIVDFWNGAIDVDEVMARLRRLP
jgi:hypothetical protein